MVLPRALVLAHRTEDLQVGKHAKATYLDFPRFFSRPPVHFLYSHFHVPLVYNPMFPIEPCGMD